MIYGLAYFGVMCLMAVWMGYRYTARQWERSPGPFFSVVLWPIALPIHLLIHLTQLGRDLKEQSVIRAQVEADRLTKENLLLKQEGLDL